MNYTTQRSWFHPFLWAFRWFPVFTLPSAHSSHASWPLAHTWYFPQVFPQDGAAGTGESVHLPLFDFPVPFPVHLSQALSMRLCTLEFLVPATPYELTYLKRPWCWEGLKAGGERDVRGWDDWMASRAQWTWVWVNSRSWWWTGAGVQPRLIQGIRSGDGVGDLFIFIYSSKIQRVIEWG